MPPIVPDPQRLPQVPAFPEQRLKVVLASHNAKKLAELQRLFAAAELHVDLVSIADFPEAVSPPETGRTFAENALIKARAAAVTTGLPALADDSGIEIDVLNDMPGVRSARWAGPECDDEANNALLLRQVDDVADEGRTGRFVCCMALADASGFEDTRTGIWPGRLATAPRGSNGFGYDPLFIPEGETRTSAELDPAEKDAQSHRARAVTAIIDVLRDYHAGIVLGADARTGDETGPTTRPVEDTL